MRTISNLRLHLYHPIHAIDTIIAYHEPVQPGNGTSFSESLFVEGCPKDCRNYLLFWLAYGSVAINFYTA